MKDGGQFDIVGAGTMAVDDFLYVDEYPLRDHKARIRAKARHLGGQTATALAAAAALGARCACAGILGNDELSCAMREGLSAAGVDLRFIKRTDATPIHSIVIAEGNSKTRTIFYDCAGAAPFPAENVDTLVSAARVVLLDQLGPQTGIALANEARRRAVRVVLDAEWQNLDGIYGLLASASDVLVSLSFGADLTGIGNPAGVAAALHDGRRNCTAITSGEDGCFAVLGSSSECVHLPAFAIEVIETTGCGDVFHGAYATCLSRGVDGTEALRYASAAAAIYASRPPGWEFLPAAADVEALLSRGERRNPSDEEAPLGAIDPSGKGKFRAPGYS
jgi:sulfofructose kinase